MVMLDELFFMPRENSGDETGPVSAPRPWRVTLDSAQHPRGAAGTRSGRGPLREGSGCGWHVGPGLELLCDEPSPPAALFAFSFHGNVRLTLSSPSAPSRHIFRGAAVLFFPPWPLLLSASPASNVTLREPRPPRQARLAPVPVAGRVADLGRTGSAAVTHC